jgi:ferredoxin, 2Fe-2S
MAMPKVTFILPDGTEKIVETDEGKTLLQAAQENGVEMESACGGNGFCTTCACKMKNGQAAIDEGRVSPVNDKEENMGVEGPDDRLGCQAKVIGDVTIEIENM